MANALYNAGREAFLGGDLDWDANNIKVVLVSASYTFSQSHANLSDVTGGFRIATSGNLASKTKVSGVADADDITIDSVASGSTVKAIIVYKDSGSAATSTLIAFLDTDGASAAISLPTNGSGITVAWNASGIFAL